jgi:hypothetical protein
MAKLPQNKTRIGLRAPRADVALWRDVAIKDRMNLSDWIRRTCNAAVQTKAIKP